MDHTLELDQNALGVSIAVGSWCTLCPRVTKLEEVDRQIDRLKAELEALRGPMKRAVEAIE